MKSWWLGALALIVAVGLTPPDAMAKRLGGGGMQRSLPSRSSPSPTPAKPNPANPGQPAAPTQQAAPTPAVPTTPPPAVATGKRSWMGPLAGLAAGIGLAALASHFGFGEAMANFMMIALFALVGMVVVGWLLRRFGAAKSNGASAQGANPFQPAYAGTAAGTGSAAPQRHDAAFAREAMPIGQGALPGSAAASFATGAVSAAAPVSNAVALPADFDRAGFEKLAKLIFIRMQAANDRCDLNDLRSFTTPEMFASIRLDLQNRGDSNQQTDVLHVDAEVLDLAREDGRDIVSVRYHGQIREEPSHPPTAFEEVWHLVRPADGSREWAIAGIQPLG